MSLKMLLTTLPILALTACAGEVTTSYPEQPPMWIVSDADSEITLYPTIHILPDGVNWKSEEMTRRLAEADEVWFEILPGSEADPALQQSVMRLGMGGPSLKESLTQEEFEALSTALAPIGMPPQVIDTMQPWMASTMLGVGLLMKDGFNPESGVEKQLQTLLGDQKVRAFETPKSQLEMMAGMPRETQISMLKDTLGSMDESLEMINDMVADWAVGDVKDLEEELVDEMKAEVPEAYAVMFTQRNENWVKMIEAEMAGSGTDFMAVGAGHLVGSDSVPAMLKAKGYDVKRFK